ncbi:GW dipeptide domain-containing protein [Lacticaseibacillus absianus]|uniref:GW dipeptide domain-containing protein n=1 Tax=Lacticaseibacillus absianus TaxID=2729623 RepID=UPI0015CC3CBC|nr:GW dipeptide domain-containing protein [Lacticaseibacillus absianus]
METSRDPKRKLGSYPGKRKAFLFILGFGLVVGLTTFLPGIGGVEPIQVTYAAEAAKFYRGPAYDVPEAPLVSINATIREDWNLLDKPWTQGGKTLGNYSTIIGKKFLGEKVRILKQVKTPNTYADLIRLKSGDFYWVDHNSLTVGTTDKLYGGGPAYEDVNARKVYREGVIQSNWNLLDRPWSNDPITVGHYNTVLGDSYNGTPVKIYAESPTQGYPSVLVKLQNGKFYWVDPKSIKITSTYFGQGPALMVANSRSVNYQATVKNNWNVTAVPWETLAMLSDIDGVNYVGKTVTVNAELDKDYGVTAALITLDTGATYWVDKKALAPQYQVISEKKYSFPYDAPRSSVPGQLYRKDGSRYVAIKPTTMGYPLYANEFGNGTSTTNSKDMVGQYFLASAEESVRLPSGETTTAVRISSDAKNWFWIDKRALSFGQRGNDVAFRSTVGSGANGAIQYYLDAADPLTSEIQSAIDFWNQRMPGTFVAVRDPSATNVTFRYGKIDNATWASTSGDLYYSISDIANVGRFDAVITLNNSGESNLVMNKMIDRQGTVQIIAHEIGHLLGLGHSGAPFADWSFYTSAENLMYGVSSGRASDYRNLTENMINAIKLSRSLGWTMIGHSIYAKDSLSSEFASAEVVLGSSMNSEVE